MREVISMLHSTPEYERAVLHLLTSHAAQIATKLDINEQIHADFADRQKWNVIPAVHGVGGTIQSANYAFEFFAGKLRSVNKLQWLQRIEPPICDLLELAEQSSELDKESAFHLSTHWLTRLGVDLRKLNERYSPSVFQVPARKSDSFGRPMSGVENNVPTPIFTISWQEAGSGRPALPGSASAAITMKVLGTTKEILELRFGDLSWAPNPPLVLSNVAQLLGQPPAPSEFVKRRLGEAAFELIQNPERTTLWLLNSHKQIGCRSKQTERAGPVELTAIQACEFSRVLLDVDCHLWDARKMCIPDYGAKLNFEKSKERVECLICYECDMIELVMRESAQTFDLSGLSHNPLVRAIQKIFPDDKAVAGLKLYPKG
jgi:hypothetical protein